MNSLLQRIRCLFTGHDWNHSRPIGMKETHYVLGCTRCPALKRKPYAWVEKSAGH